MGRVNKQELGAFTAKIINLTSGGSGRKELKR